jgi:hypothetical protein
MPKLSFNALKYVALDSFNRFSRIIVLDGKHDDILVDLCFVKEAQEEVALIVIELPRQISEPVGQSSGLKLCVCSGPHMLLFFFKSSVNLPMSHHRHQDRCFNRV